MPRSLKKGPYVNKKLLERIKALKKGTKTIIRQFDVID